MGLSHQFLKNGTKSDPSNYRGICVSSCLGKLFCSILNQRLLEHVESLEILHKSQIGFLQIIEQRITFLRYAKTFGKETESAKPLLNLLDVLTVDNIYRLEILKFAHLWHNGLLPRVFDDIFKYARNMHGYNARFSAKHNFYKHRVNTNVGKQSVTFMATDIWKDLPSYFKHLSVLAFPKKIKRYLLSEQKLN